MNNKLSVNDAETLVSAWEEKLRLANANMRDMRMLGAYKLITQQPKPTFEGLTAKELTPAMLALDEIWSNFNLLEGKVAEARALLGHLPTFGAGDKLAEVESLLTTPSIKLPAVHIPLLQRDLLTPAEISQAITPERLLEVVLQAFGVAVKVVARMDEILEKHYEDVATITQRIEGLELRAQACLVKLPMLTAASQQATAASANVYKDPLGMQAQFEGAIADLLNQAESQLVVEERVFAARLAAEAKLRQELEGLLDAAGIELAALESLQGQVDTKRGEVEERIQAPEHKPRNPEILVRLRTQLHTMETNFNKGMTKPVQIGLTNWKTMAGQFRSLEEAAQSMYDSMLEERQELRGIFEVQRVRAGKYGLLEHDNVSALGQKVVKLLWRSGGLTPLKEARTAVEAYRAALVPLFAEAKAGKAS